MAKESFKLTFVFAALNKERPDGLYMTSGGLMSLTQNGPRALR